MPPLPGRSPLAAPAALSRFELRFPPAPLAVALGLLCYPVFVLGGPWEAPLVVRGAGLCLGALCSTVGCPPSMHLSSTCLLILRIFRYLNKCLRTFELSGKSPKDRFISFWGRTSIFVFPGRTLGVSSSDCLHTELYTQLKRGRD